MLEDFEGSTDDLYEAVGPILMEMDSHATEEGVLAICGKLHHSLDLEYVWSCRVSTGKSESSYVTKADS